MEQLEKEIPSPSTNYYWLRAEYVSGKVSIPYLYRFLIMSSALSNAFGRFFFDQEAGGRRRCPLQILLLNVGPFTEESD
jgi:hypothetical protein